MSAAPQVTVLMTLYNKGPWVAGAIRSVLDQTFGDLELIIVDDASTDDGPAQVRSFHDPRIRLLTIGYNTGRAAAANKGYDSAEGRYVAVLDADDLMHPERLARQVAFLDSHTAVGAVGSNSRAFGSHDDELTYPETDEAIRGMMFFRSPILYGATTFRRSVLEEHRIRCDTNWKSPGMDYLFLLMVGRYTNYANIPEVLTYYRQGEQNMGHGRDKWADMARIFSWQYRSFGFEEQEDDARLQLMLHFLFKKTPDKQDVRALRKYMDRLIAWNRYRKVFTPHLFEQELERRWRRLFFYLSEREVPAAFTHLRLTESWHPADLNHLLRSALKRWVVKRPAIHE